MSRSRVLLRSTHVLHSKDSGIALDDGTLPPANNHVENQIRPVAVGRSNCLVAGLLRAGQGAATVMSLMQPAKLNGHGPFVYLKVSSLLAKKDAECSHWSGFDRNR